MKKSIERVLKLRKTKVANLETINQIKGGDDPTVTTEDKVTTRPKLPSKKNNEEDKTRIFSE